MRPKFTRKVVKTTETPLIVSSIDYVESHRPQLRENRRSSVARRYLMSDIPINVSKSDSYQYKEFYRNASVPEFIDPVFAKTSPKRSFSIIANERFGLEFAKLGL